MGLVEIIFSGVAFFIIWFIIFKLILLYNEKKPLRNMAKKLEEQEKKVFTVYGKEIKPGNFMEENPKKTNKKTK